MAALDISPLDAAEVAARLCVIFCYELWMLPDNPATLDVFLDQINEHQGQNWQSEFQW
jgi:hypothetical protein